MITELDAWTFQRFKFEFFLCLTKVIDQNKSNSVSDYERGFLTDRKYYARARDSLYWVSISKPSKPIPTFLINFSDLTPRLQKEFQAFCKYNEEREIAMFLREIAARFFENIDHGFTHDSVLSHLNVVMEK